VFEEEVSKSFEYFEVEMVLFGEAIFLTVFGEKVLHLK